MVFTTRWCGNSTSLSCNVFFKTDFPCISRQMDALFTDSGGGLGAPCLKQQKTGRPKQLISTPFLGDEAALFSGVVLRSFFRYGQLVPRL